MIKFQLFDPPAPGWVEEHGIDAEGQEFISSKKTLSVGFKNPDEGAAHPLGTV